MQPIQLSIPTPCHENWNNMTSNQQGRFCGSCAKTVVDFSAMTDTQLLHYFENLKSENVCGRVYPDQLDRNLEQPSIASSRKKIHWLWQYAATLLLFFTKGLPAKAQGEIRTAPVAKADTLKEPVPIMMGGIRKLPLPHNIGLIGAALPQYFITDENFVPVAGATVQLLPQGNWLVADSTGKINLGKNHKVTSLLISAVGFENKSVEIKAIPDNNIQLTANEKILEDVIMISDLSIERRTVMMGGLKVSGIPITQDKEPDEKTSGSEGIYIFPNPAVAGGVVNFSFSAGQTGDYKIYITDATGHLKLVQEYKTSAKSFIQKLAIPANWAAGIYFVTVTDLTGKNISSSKLLVE